MSRLDKVGVQMSQVDSTLLEDKCHHMSRRSTANQVVQEWQVGRWDCPRYSRNRGHNDLLAMTVRGHHNKTQGGMHDTRIHFATPMSCQKSIVDKGREQQQRQHSKTLGGIQLEQETLGGSIHQQCRGCSRLHSLVQFG